MPLALHTPWYRQLGRNLASLALFKGVGIPVFIAVYFAIYMPLLRNPLFEVTEIPLTAIDRMIGVQSWALPVYFSLWFYVSLAPGMIANRKELFSYSGAVAVLSVAGFLFSLFWPTVVPTGGYDWSGYPALARLKAVDSPGNACPSMHVAFAFFSAWWIAHRLKLLGAPRVWHIVSWVWCAGIVYSTMATKQHVLLDVLAGFALGGVASWAYFCVAVRAAQPAVSGPVPLPDSCLSTQSDPAATEGRKPRSFAAER